MSRRDLDQHQRLADNEANDVLLITLDAAVPLWLAELRSMTPIQRAEHVRTWAAEAAEVVASHGDTLMFRTRSHKLRAVQLGPASRRKPGAEVSTAATFNALARGLAALAMSPGGVLFAGRHWCVKHPWGIACTSSTDLTCTGSGLDADPPAGGSGVVTVATTGVL